MTWQNDLQAANMRSYFDRHIPRVDRDQLPKVKRRPHWNIDIKPEAESADEPNVYRIWDAWHAHWKDQWQWLPKEPGQEKDVLNDDMDTPPPPPEDPNLRNNRTPRNGADLKNQRSQEKEWDKHHGTVFSRNNQEFQPNFRSYFDRWKDDVKTVDQSTVPTWRLPVEMKPLNRSRSEPIDRSVQRHMLLGQRPWAGNFNIIHT